MPEHGHGHPAKIGQHGQRAGKIVVAGIAGQRDHGRQPGRTTGLEAVGGILDGEAGRSRQAQLCQYPLVNIRRRLLVRRRIASADFFKQRHQIGGQQCRDVFRRGGGGDRQPQASGMGFAQQGLNARTQGNALRAKRHVVARLGGVQ